MTKFECACGSKCEQIPYPVGKRHLCEDCGAEWYDLDASLYREKQRKQLHELMAKIQNTETEQ